MAWKMHKQKPNPDWEKVRDSKSGKKHEEWEQLNILEEVERKKIEKIELQKKLETTKDPDERMAIIVRLRYL